MYYFSNSSKNVKASASIRRGASLFINFKKILGIRLLKQVIGRYYKLENFMMIRPNRLLNINNTIL
jgi:hypothetical protein